VQYGHNIALEAMKVRFNRLRDQRGRGIITSEEFSLAVETMISNYCDHEIDDTQFMASIDATPFDTELDEVVPVGRHE
jgi:hypothetical protein